MEPSFFALFVIIFIVGFVAGNLFFRTFRPTSDDETETVVRVGLSNVSGRGVFAARNIKNGAIVERCPVLELDEKDLRKGEELFYTYGDEWWATRNLQAIS